MLTKNKNFILFITFVILIIGFSVILYLHFELLNIKKSLILNQQIISELTYALAKQEEIKKNLVLQNSSFNYYSMLKDMAMSIIIGIVITKFIESTTVLVLEKFNLENLLPDFITSFINKKDIISCYTNICDTDIECKVVLVNNKITDFLMRPLDSLDEFQNINLFLCNLVSNSTVTQTQMDTALAQMDIALSRLL